MTGEAGIRYLVELASGTPFPRYCEDHIFEPLGMHDTHWRLADAPVERHAVPYSLLDAGFTLPDGWSPSDMLPAPTAPATWPPPPGSQFPHCAYEFATYPDGGLRTTARDLARLLTAYVNGGRLGQTRILREATARDMLTDQSPEGYPGEGLGWSARPHGSGNVLWGHGGPDPGIRAAMYFDPKLRIGIVILPNTPQDLIKGALDHVYQYCLDHDWPP